MVIISKGRRGGEKRIVFIIGLPLIFVMFFSFFLIADYLLNTTGGSDRSANSYALSFDTPLALGKTGLAEKESLGFFKDIPDEAWKRYKNRFQLTQPNNIQDEKTNERYSRYPNYFWANNFEPEFSCPHEFRLGKLGDGGKWVCDPHRILSDTGKAGQENLDVGKNGVNAGGSNVQGSCIVYSVGSNGNYDFEKEVKTHVSPDCEIHTFDINEYGRHKNFTEEAEKVGVTFHHTGLGRPTKRVKNFSTFKQIVKELNHENKLVDIVKIDCERCEYTQYKEWLENWNEIGLVVRQVMLEIHAAEYPTVIDIFESFQKAGYVLFHKEANYLNEGKSVEVAWILMSNDFQVPL